MFSTTRPRDASLRMLAPDGTPLRRIYVCPAHGDRPIPADEIVRGYPLASGEIVPVDDEELERLDPRRTRDVEIRRFVERSAIAPTYFERSYVCAPAGDSHKAYHLLARVMEDTDRSGIATFVMRGKQHVAAIVADHGVLRAEIMHFHDEVRGASEIGLPSRAKTSPREVSAVERAIQRLTADDIDREEMRDVAARRLHELAEQKRKRGQDIAVAPEAAEPEGQIATIVDLMAVLKQRLGRQPARSRASRSAPPRRRQGVSKQELLERARRLGIAGRSRMTKEQLIDALERAVS
jgi:DNA end-binding protein Ku